MAVGEAFSCVTYGSAPTERQRQVRHGTRPSRKKIVGPFAGLSSTNMGETLEMANKEAPAQRQGFTKTLALSVFSAAFGSSFLFGWHLGVMNSPQTVISLWIRDIFCKRTGVEPAQKEGETEDIWCMKLDPAAQATMFNDNTALNWIWASVTAAFTVGGLIGALSTVYFVGKFGPKKTMLWNNVVVLVSTLLLSLAGVGQSFEMLIIGRFIFGLSAGVSSGVPAVYFSEISPAHLKGSLGSVHQLSVTIAICIAQVLGIPQVFGNATLWPILFAFAVVPAVTQILTLPGCPESPKWLFIQKGDEAEARKALIRLRGTTDVEGEMEEMRAEYETAKSVPKVTIGDLFSNPFLRRLTIVAAMLMVCQQLSGINAVMFYSTSIFQSAGLDASSAQYATIGMGAVNILMTLISVILVEKAGRKTLLMIGYSGMTVTTVLLACSMLVFSGGQPSVETPGAPNPFGFFAYFSIVFVLVYVILFATGPGSIPWFLVSELFTQGPRAAANSIAVGTNWFCSLIIALAFPIVQAAIKEYSFLIFGGLLVLFVAYTYTQVIETKGKTSDEIQIELRKKFKK